MTTRTLAALALSIITLVGPSACSTAPKTEVEREELQSDAQTALNTMKKKDLGLADFLKTARGFAVFPSVGKGGAGVGGAYGRGIVYDNGVAIGYCDMSQATIGLQLGGQTYKELIAFENRAALDRFVSGTFEFSANASAVALKSGASKTAKYRNGVAVFTDTNGGLMAEASVGGQKFTYKPIIK